MLQDFIDIIAAPSAAFARLKEKPTVLWPLLLLLALTVSTQMGYFFMNDEGFVRDQIIEQATAGRDLTNQQLKQIETSVGKMSIRSTAMISSAAVLILIPLILALNAWYLSFMSKFSFSQLSFKHFFSLICWTSVPTFFAFGAAWLILLTNSNGQVSQSELQPLSINNLLALNMTSQTLAQFNVMQLWSLALVALGYQQWTKKSVVASFAITWAPFLLIYGGIALFAYL